MNRALSWLASFRLRLLLRTSFLLLALATVGMAVYVLQEEKQRSYDNYQASFGKTKEQVAAQLRHPTGQLALLNPPRSERPVTPLHPVLLPFSALDFDDQTKVRNAVEMAGCLVQYPRSGSLCVAIGNNPWAGGFIYAAGTFASGALVPHRIGDEILDQSHRLRVEVSLRGQTYRWIAPFEPLGDADPRREGIRGRFTGYVDRESRSYKGARTVREFRGWVWQSSQCIAPSAVSQGASQDDCERKSFFSLRLPVEVLRDALFAKRKPEWPPADLDQIQVRVEVLPPGEGEALFDSNAAGAVAPFSLSDLQALLLPGETLHIRKTNAPRHADLVSLRGRDTAASETFSPLLLRLIRQLPVERYEAPLSLEEEVATPLGNYTFYLDGDARSVNQGLGVVATRIAWFVGAMLLAIGLAWLVIEVGIIRRITLLTRRSSALSQSVKTTGGLERFDLADLRGSDELGILANCLHDLLRRVKEDAEREKLRAEQEKDMWHAVGHEIMSPLQSLLALHGSEADPSHRYISRMQQAIRILYGSASPSEAFQASTLEVMSVDIDGFLRNVADNAVCVGIDGVLFQGVQEPVLVRADEYPLEDVVTHVLRNAAARRREGTPITMTLEASETLASIRIHNQGAHIPPELMDKIFEYGVSDQPEAGASGNRGQGLFVAKTYMAKMGGSIQAHNTSDGVCFILGLQRVMASASR